MSVVWRAFTAGEWNLQIDPQVLDRVYVMNCIAATKTSKSKTYHAQVFVDSIEYCEYAEKDKVIVPNQVVDICREMIYNFNDFWYNSQDA